MLDQNTSEIISLTKKKIKKRESEYILGLHNLYSCLIIYTFIEFHTWHLQYLPHYNKRQSTFGMLPVNAMGQLIFFQ